MHCPSCGKEIPTDSMFCLHCGSAVSASVTVPSIEWEYWDFIYTWPPDDRPSVELSPSELRPLILSKLPEEFWRERQVVIMTELQKWLDQGWESVTGVGPTTIRLREYHSFEKHFSGCFGTIFLIFMGIISLGIFPLLVYALQTFVEPTEFRATMRRPKVLAS